MTSSAAVSDSHRTPSGNGVDARRLNNGEPARSSRTISRNGSTPAQGDPPNGEPRVMTVSIRPVSRLSAMACPMTTPPRLCPTRCTLSAPVAAKILSTSATNRSASCSTDVPSGGYLIASTATPRALRVLATKAQIDLVPANPWTRRTGRVVGAVRAFTVQRRTGCSFVATAEQPQGCHRHRRHQHGGFVRLHRGGTPHRLNRRAARAEYTLESPRAALTVCRADMFCPCTFRCP